MMSGLFTIPISGIKEGHHLFEFKINKKFFELFEESEIKEGELIAVVEIEKSSTHLDLDYKDLRKSKSVLRQMSGNVRSPCRM